MLNDKCSMINDNCLRSNLYIILALALGFSACGETYFYEKTYNLPNTQWSYSDTLDFEVDIQDTIKTYNLILDIEHSADYPFQNNYVYIHTHLPSGEHLGKQLSLDLAQKSGKWNGECSGDKCDLRIVIQQNAYFNQIGKHRFSIEQYMRTDSLSGIYAIGLKVQETGMTR